MGYYSTMENSIKIKNEKIAELRKLRGELIINPSKLNAGHLTQYIQFDLEQMIIEDDGMIYWDELYGKWYADKILAEILAPFVESGDIVYQGEDGERWGYHFDGTGRVFNLIFVKKVGSEIFF